MANPNIVNVSTIYGKTAVANVSTSVAAIVNNAPSSGSIYKINSLVVSKDLAPVEKSDGVSSVISGMNMICKEQKGTQGEVTFKENDGIKSINITGNKSYGYYKNFIL